MPCYKLVAIDIDGTLLDSRAELRPAARQALRDAVEAGIRVVLCTGRRYRTALPIAQDLDLGLPIICHSGALVKDTATHHTQFANPLGDGDLQALLAALADFGLTPMAYTDSYEQGVDFFVERDAPLTRYHEDYLAKNEGSFRLVASLRREVPAPVLQVCTFGELDELRAIRPQLRERLAGRTTCHLLSSAQYLGYFLEFQHGSASKWAALLALTRSCGLSAAEVVAIGDDENDISMLRAAGLGVAMGNAADPVKSAADLVAASNDEDGVARVIEELIRDA
jgi:hypothetical protein